MEKGEKWTGSEGIICTSGGAEESGIIGIDVFGASYPMRKLGRCIISGLQKDDTQMLGDFFRKYGANLLRSVGRGSFEDWISLVQVPSLGRWGSVAKACEQGAELAVLAAAVYLGAPRALRPFSAQEPISRPSTWLDSKVITSLNW